MERDATSEGTGKRFLSKCYDTRDMGWGRDIEAYCKLSSRVIHGAPTCTCAHETPCLY